MTRSPEFKDLIVELTAGDQVRARHALEVDKKRLKAIAAAEDDLHEHYQKIIEALVERQQEDTEKLRRQLNFRQSYIDRNASEFIRRVVQHINTEAAAIAAEEFYDYAWFCDQPFSIDVLKRVAGALIDTCKQFRIDMPPVWIALRDSSIDLELPERKSRHVMRARLLEEEQEEAPEDLPWETPDVPGQSNQKQVAPNSSAST